MEERTELNGAGGVVRYRPVAGYPWYWVGDDGSVRSTLVPGGGPRRPRWYRLRINTGGGKCGAYPSVYLMSSTFPRERALLVVARLVLDAFVGPCPLGHRLAHRDGNPDNTSLDNLSWVSDPAERIETTAAGVVRFRPVGGYEGYWIGDDGSVRSTRVKGQVRGDVWIELRPTVGSHGYKYVRLAPRAGAAQTVFLVHRLVLSAFVGPAPAGMECCHGDGDPCNNALSNLRWDTRSGNSRDKKRHGRTPAGESHGNAKLTEAQVANIRALVASGKSKNSLSRQFGISRRMIARIVTGIAWTHTLPEIVADLVPAAADVMESIPFTLGEDDP